MTLGNRPLTNLSGGVRPQLTFLFTVAGRAREIVKCEFNKFILCDMGAFEREYSHFFIEAIGCEILLFLEFNWRRDLCEFFCYGPRGRMNTRLFL